MYDFVPNLRVLHDAVHRFMCHLQFPPPRAAYAHLAEGTPSVSLVLAVRHKRDGNAEHPTPP